MPQLFPSSTPAVTVWGGGNLGYATLADLLLQNKQAGQDINVQLAIPRQSPRGQEQREQIVNSGKILLNDTLSGVSHDIPIRGNQIFGVWESGALKKALKESQTIFVTLPDLPSARKSVLKTLLSADLKGKTVVLAPGGEGGVLKAARLLSKYQARDTIIGLMETGPYGARLNNATINSKRKGVIKVGAFPQDKTQDLIQRLNSLFPATRADGQRVMRFQPVSPLEIILSGQNYIYHVAVALDSKNLERGTDYNHYWQGVTPEVAKKMEHLDQERIAIGQAFGIQLEPLNEALHNHYGIGLYSSYYDAFHASKSLYSSHVPKPAELAHHRYVVEDLPGVEVIERLGQIAGISTPATSELRKTARANAFKIGTRPEEIRGYRKALAALPDTVEDVKAYFRNPADWIASNSKAL